MLRVSKRSGQLEPFTAAKIKKAIFAAFSGLDTRVPPIEPIARSVVDYLLRQDGDILDIEVIQDIVEQVLMTGGHIDAGKAFILYREGRRRLREARLAPDPSALSSYIAVAKYARDGESWVNTVDRLTKMHATRFPQLDAKIFEAMIAVHDRKVLPSMRSLQFGGEAIEKNHARMYNCCFTHIDRPEVFGEIMWLLLAGCGVGYSVQIQHISKLPPLGHMSREVRHFTIPDSIEGWGDALTALIQAAVRGVWVEFNYSLIREEGLELHVSGGKAPGHLTLRESLEKIRKILLRAAGRNLRPIECYDILCHAAGAVLSGGIRRSATLALFSLEDTEMLYAKAHGNFDPRRDINTQRAYSNNSCAMLRSTITWNDFHRVMEVNREWGEPGFYFTDDLDWGCNPCGEIGLVPIWYYGSVKKSGVAFCNLTEINAATCKDKEDFWERCKVAAFLGTLQAAYTDFNYLSPESKKIAERDALLGVSITGICDSPWLLDADVLEWGVEIIKATNEGVAKQIGIEPARRLTTIKPSGTASLLLGCVGAGLHPHHARRYFRRVIANKNEAAAQVFVKHNPHMAEEGDNNWWLVFPVQAPENAITLDHETGATQLKRALLLYKHWVKSGSIHERMLTHNVSCTITMDDSERASILERVFEERNNIAALSFAPRLLDKIYPHAPREAVTEVDESRWNALISNYTKVNWEGVGRDGVETGCDSESCENNNLS